MQIKQYLALSDFDQFRLTNPVFLKLFTPRPPFEFKKFKGLPEEWACIEKHPEMGSLI